MMLYCGLQQTSLLLDKREKQQCVLLSINSLLVINNIHYVVVIRCNIIVVR